MSEVSGQEIGGIYVTVGANVDPLRRDIEGLKQQLAAAEKLLGVAVPFTIVNNVPQQIAAIKQQVLSAGSMRLTVGADTSAFKAEVVSASAGMKLVAPVEANIGPAKVQLAELQAATAKPIIIPVQFQIAAPPAMPQLSAGGSVIGGGGGFIGNAVGAGMMALPAPDGGGRMGGGGAKFVQSRIVDPGEGGALAVAGTAAAMGSASEGIGAAASVAEGWGAKFAAARVALNGSAATPFQALRMAGRVFKIVAIADATLTTLDEAVGTVKAAAKVWNHADEQEIAQSRESVRDSVKSLPLIGHYIDKFGNRIGNAVNSAISAPANLLTTGRFESDIQAGERIKAEAAAVDAKTAKMSQLVAVLQSANQNAATIGRAADFQLASRGKSSTEIAAMQAKDNRIDYETEARLSVPKGHALTPTQTDTIAKLAKAEQVAVADANRETVANYQASLRDAGRIVAAAGTERLRIVGATTDAERQELRASLDGEIEDLKAAITEMQAQGASAGRVIAAQAKVQALEQAKDVRIESQNMMIARADQQFIAGSKREVGITQARMSGDEYLAREKEIKKQYVPELTKIAEDPNYGTGSDKYKQLETEFNSKLQQVAADKAVESERRIRDAKAETAVIGLQLAKDSLGAQVLAYDNATNSIIDDLKKQHAEQKDIDATVTERSAGRKLMVQQQVEQKAAAEMGLQGRKYVAQAQAAGESSLGSTLQRIVSMEQELAVVPKDLRGDLSDAIKAELGAMKAELIHPNQYAEEFDVQHQAVGGIGSESTLAITESVKAIDTATQRIVAGSNQLLDHAQPSIAVVNPLDPTSSGRALGSSRDATRQYGETIDHFRKRQSRFQAGDESASNGNDTAAARSAVRNPSAFESDMRAMRGSMLRDLQEYNRKRAVLQSPDSGISIGSPAGLGTIIAPPAQMVAPIGGKNATISDLNSVLDRLERASEQRIVSPASDYQIGGSSSIDIAPATSFSIGGGATARLTDLNGTLNSLDAPGQTSSNGGMTKDQADKMIDLLTKIADKAGVGAFPA